MQFSTLNTGNRNNGKSAKFALVAGLHVALGILFIHGINTKTLSLSSLPDAVLVVVQPDPPAPLTPPDPPKPMPTLAPPDVFVPKVEVDVAPPPPPAEIHATTETEPQSVPPTTARVAPDTPAVPATARDTGQMHTAVFADANGCALPAYPARAARNGDTGTTMLALLVGVDGRVTSARVERSSGSRDLDRAAVDALSLCRFKPATSNGVAEAGWARLAYVWTLD